MNDLDLDENNDTHLGGGNDFETTEGRAHFEQQIRVHITDVWWDLIGDLDPDRLQEVLEVRARRVARDLDNLDSIEYIDINRADDVPEKLVVEITYDTGEPVTFGVEQ